LPCHTEETSTLIDGVIADGITVSHGPWLLCDAEKISMRVRIHRWVKKLQKKGHDIASA
jgi:hypothetical protein